MTTNCGTRPDRELVFDAASDSVARQTTGGEPAGALASITLDIHDVDLVRSEGEQAQP